MAKSPAPSGRSKIRIFFVDADLAPGDIQELTNALSSAIRPTHMIQRISATKLVGGPTDGSSAGDATEEGEFEEVNDITGEEEPAPETRGASKPRKYRSPRPVNDLDMNAGGKSFEEFAKEKGSPGEHVPRYLVAAAWLAQYAKIPTVSTDHVFTCYKAADWVFDPRDPGFPLRHLKREGFGDTQDGKFTINHLGLAKVEKMKDTKG